MNAVHVWGLAAALGGRVLLRIEDHDRQRFRAEFEAAILDDLDWLGFVPDMHVTAQFRAGACQGRQSDREPVYRAALATLVTQGLVYGCRCTRRDIEAASAGRLTDGDELHYPGTCRSLRLPLDEGLGWRLHLASGIERFHDGVHGPSHQDPSHQCGDLLLRDRLGNWTYQFAVVADDTAQGIDLVTRGDDLFASTGRQIHLARLLGRAVPPVFVHHGLVMKSATQKLSKSDGDSGVAEMRAAGWRAAQVLGAAAAAAGLLDRPRDLQVSDLAALVAAALPATPQV